MVLSGDALCVRVPSLPAGLCVDRKGVVYVADQSNYNIRRVGSRGDVTTLAGHPDPFGKRRDGPAQQVGGWPPPPLTTLQYPRRRPLFPRFPF